MIIPADIGKTRGTTGSAVRKPGTAPVERGPAGPRWRGGWLLAALACVVCGACHTGAREPEDLAIWRIVDQGCNRPSANLPGENANLQCETANGYAVLKDRCGATHFLLIPTRRRAGVESADLLQADEPNYFALAWGERGRSRVSSAAPGGASEDIGLAINSRYGRSQSQLHIHIDRVRPEVRASLRALALASGASAQTELLGHRYRVAHVTAIAQNPFAWAVAEWGAQTQDERARLSVAVVSDGAAGFFLLSGRADLAAFDRGHAEELLVPHFCE